MTDLSYHGLLKRVQSKTIKTHLDGERFKVPKADVLYEGNTTVVKNFDKIADIINREKEHLLKFLLGHIGTAGNIVSGRAVFQGKIPLKTIQDRIDEYIEEYVICSECNRPDTHLVKKDRLILIRCDACGAFRPVGSIKKRQSITPTVSLKEGEVYEVTIKDIGKRGDGVAYVDKYAIYISGAVKGSTVKVRIDKISGNAAFGSIVQ